MSQADESGTPFFVIAWWLVRQGEQWKLDEMLHFERGECGIEGCVVEEGDTRPETTGGEDPCASIPEGDFRVEECEVGRTNLDGISDRPLTYMWLVVSYRSETGPTGIDSELAFGMQEQTGLDIVWVGSENVEPFSSLEVEDLYSEWRAQGMGEEMDEQREQSGP